MVNAVEQSYATFYADMQFERRGLFETVQKALGTTTALYPGCSTHVTPSFYVPHVVYVDKSDAARTFFAQKDQVLALVNRHRTYKQSPYVRFLEQDYTSPLPLPEQGFDLLISIYAGGISRACMRYIKVGGFVLTNNHHDDGGEAARDGGLQLEAVIHARKEDYRVSRENLDQYFVPRVDWQARRRYVRELSSRPVYKTNADYYLFKRVRAG